jgi:hypothetical protein
MDHGEYLACYDYGMGGLWFLFTAENANQVREKYPFLVVFDQVPDWMTDEDLLHIRTNYPQAIDEPPCKTLADIMQSIADNSG